MKLCPVCKVDKPDEAFGSYKGALRSYCAECHKVYMRVYYERNKAALLAKQTIYLATLPPGVRQARTSATHQKYKVERNADMREWRVKNKDHLRTLTNAWKDANPGRTRASAQAYRARKAGATGRFTEADVQVMYSKQNGLCNCCRVPLGDKYHRDHVVALATGGSNEASNMQLLCKPCNCAKGSRPMSALLALRGI